MIVPKETFKEPKKIKGAPYLVVYFDKDQKSHQIIRPNPKQFDGNWKDLAHFIGGDNFYRFEIR